MHEARNDHQRITNVAGETEKHFQLHAERQVRIPNSSIQLEPNLQHALGPATLLRLEGVHFDWNFCRRFFIKQIDKSPTHQLGAKTQISILSQRVVLPAAAQLDRFAPPDARGPVEVEKISGAVARGLLDHEMAVEHDRLQARQQIVRAVDVRPAHLRATNNWIGEVVDELAQKIRLGHKVGIEDRD